MSVTTFLYKLKKIEQKTNDLYTNIYKKIAHKYEKLADLFLALAEEETIHLKKIDMVLNVVKEMDDSSINLSFPIQQLDELLEVINKKENQFWEKTDKMSIEEILDIALTIERDLKEQHFSIMLKTINPTIDELLSFLANEDEAHLKKLQTFITLV